MTVPTLARAASRSTLDGSDGRRSAPPGGLGGDSPNTAEGSVDEDDRQDARHHGRFGRSPERSVGLRPVNPHPPAEGRLIDPLTHGVDDAGRVAVRAHPRMRH